MEWLAKTHDAEVTLIRVALAHTFPGMDPVQHQVNVVREAEEYLAKVDRVPGACIGARGSVPDERHG